MCSRMSFANTGSMAPSLAVRASWGYGWDPTGSRRREPAGLGITRSGSSVADQAAATGRFCQPLSLRVGGEREVGDDGLALDGGDAKLGFQTVAVLSRERLLHDIDRRGIGKLFALADNL